MRKEQAIRFLQTIQSDACILIFTRDDASTQTPDEREVTDEEWRAIIRDFDKHYLDDIHWEQFGHIVTRNLNSNP